MSEVPPPAPAALRLSLTGNPAAEISRMGEAVEVWGEAAGLSPRAIFDLNLALEEIALNAMKYGGETPGKVNPVEVEVALLPGRVAASVEDPGRPFNPLERPEPDLGEPLDSRAIGGLGIFLARRVMHDLKYERREGRNRVTMERRREEPPAG